MTLRFAWRKPVYLGPDGIRELRSRRLGVQVVCGCDTWRLWFLGPLKVARRRSRA